jgi:hypothetical protein
MDRETAGHLKRVNTGLLAETLIDSRLGKYLVEKSEVEVTGLIELLRVADPEDAKEIRRLQTDIQIAERALIWLREAILAGQQAEHIIHDQEGNEDYGN